MRLFISLLLILSIAISLCSCNHASDNSVTTECTFSEEDAKKYKVPNPMAYPNYAFSETPTPQQLRQTAVRAMKDLLSIQWCTATNIAYYKSGPVSKKQFQHKPMNTYGGTIYSNASTGLFQFMEFYNPKTGMLEYPYRISQMQYDIGNSCADSLLWGWSSVCNSISAGFFPVNMVYKNGYLPVGTYRYNFSISSYNECPSYKIIEINGKEIIFESYTHMLPADALVSTSANHAMMVIEPPNVVYNSDGTINTSESTVVIQDQRGGNGKGFYDATENGNVIHYSGRTRHVCTFDWLLEKHYIPVTCAEFTGAKAYDSVTVTANQGCTALEEVKNTTISSNYPLAVIRAAAEDENGNREIWGRELFGGDQPTGVPTSFQLSQLDCWRTAAHFPLNKPGNIVKIEVVTPTGEIFTPIEITL